MRKNSLTVAHLQIRKYRTVLCIILVVGCVAVGLLSNRPQNMAFFSPFNPELSTGENVNGPIFESLSTYLGVSSSPKSQPTYVEQQKEYYPYPKRITMRGIEGKGVGYPDGYATLEALFGPYDLPSTLVPLVDLRGHHIYNDTYAVNGGIIGRHPYRDNKLIIGGNAYLDYRQGCLGHYFHLGLGFELLGPEWDFRLNGSLPLNHQNRHVHTVYNYEGPYVATCNAEENSYDVYNAEVGHYFFNNRTFILYLAGGPYYLSSSGGGKSIGARVRLRAQYNDFFAVELSTCQDHIFHSIYQAEFSVTLPLYQMGAKNQGWSIFDRQLYQPVQRFEITPLRDRCSWETNF